MTRAPLDRLPAPQIQRDATATDKHHRLADGLPRALCLSVALPLLVFFSCRPEAPTQTQQSPEAKSPGPSASARFEAKDILALWARRFEKRPPGSFDTPLPKLSDQELRQVVDQWFTALSTGRGMQRFANSARDTLLADPGKAIAGLTAFLADKENDVTSKARALSLFAGSPHPILTSFCLQHLDDRKRLIRLECVRRLDEARSLGVIPRLLRRTREFYEEDPEILAAIYKALAHVGNLSGLDTLLSWLQRDDLRALAGTALIDIVALYGPAYEESDGWAGLARKARTLLALWNRDGHVAFIRPERTWSQDDRYLLDREFWLFLRHLNGQNLRVVDEARFVGEHAGIAMVPLLRESLTDQRLRQRYHALEVLIALGLPGKPAEKEVRALFGQPLTRSYALNAYGSIHGEGALEVLLGVLRSDPALPDRQKDEKIAALAGLAGLESPASFDFLRQLFTQENDVELKAWTAKAWIASSRGARREARAYLQGLLDKKAFHEPTLLEMLRDANR